MRTQHFKPEPAVVPEGTKLPSIGLAIVTMTPQLVERAIHIARSTAKRDVPAFVFANSCHVDLSGVTVLHSKENAGVVPGLHALSQVVSADIVVFIHDDLELLERDWDVRIARRFAASPDCVVVGFGGAETLGRKDMWTCGSEWEPTRGPFGSNLTCPPGMDHTMTCAEEHGPRLTEDCRAATFDGFGFAVRRSFLEQIGGFSWWTITNHGYDHAIACQVQRHKKELWLVPIAIAHPRVGLTSQRPDGLAAAAKFGGNHGVFLQAIALLREQFRDVLPFGLPGVEHVTNPIEHIQPIIDNYFGKALPSALPPNPGGAFALDLLKRTLTGDLYEDPSAAPWTKPVYDAKLRELGSDWPKTAHTMIGRKRLDNFQFCIEDALARDIPGDIVETGVWRGGASILARGVLKAHGIIGRDVWVCDSFAGLPPPSRAFPQDAGDMHFTNQFLAVSLDEVKANFERYDLLDEQVRFLPGWFKDTLASLPVRRIATLRLDGDMYESTWQALDALYPKLSKGGHVIIDDYYDLESCRRAVADYRAKHGIEEPIQDIDAHGVFWRREKTWWKEPAAVTSSAPAVPTLTLAIPTLSKQGAVRTPLIEQAKRGTRPPDHIFVIDNGGHVTRAGRIAGVEIHVPAEPLSVAASWNLALKKFGDWVVIANDDIDLSEIALDRFVDTAENLDAPLIVCEHGDGFPCFLLKHSTIRAIGYFDEQFAPACYEDTDYLRRLYLRGLKPHVLPGDTKHGKGGTTAREAGLDLTKIMSTNLARYVAKWGGAPGLESTLPMLPAPTTGPVTRRPRRT